MNARANYTRRDIAFLQMSLLDSEVLYFVNLSEVSEAGLRAFYPFYMEDVRRHNRLGAGYLGSFAEIVPIALEVLICALDPSGRGLRISELSKRADGVYGR